MSRGSPNFLGVVSSDYGKPRSIVTLNFILEIDEMNHRAWSWILNQQKYFSLFQGTYEHKHVDFFSNQTQQQETAR